MDWYSSGQVVHRVRPHTNTRVSHIGGHLTDCGYNGSYGQDVRLDRALSP
jgi:hypothetical protein